MFKSNFYYLWGERMLGQTHFILGTVCFFSCLEMEVVEITCKRLHPDRRTDSTDKPTKKPCSPFKQNCNYTCPAKRFGFNCTQYCSLTCINSQCHSLTGACNEGCTAGFTGDKCQRACPAECFGKLCERNDSFCSKGCLPGYTGIHCLKACLNCAGNGSCHQITGACYSGCLQGYSGDSCLLASRSFSQDPTTFTSIGLVACVAILIMVGISLYRIKIQKKLENVSFPTYGTRNRRMATVLDLDE